MFDIIIDLHPFLTYRVCLDFRKVNEVAKKDAYPLPHMDTILSKLRSAKYITTIDPSKAFHQIPLARNKREYTAFTVPGRGLLHYKRMPFGLSGAPATFQRLMDRLIGPELEPHVFTYLDDIIVVIKRFEEHLKWLGNVLTILKEAGFTVNQEKSHFCCSKVRYLGYIVNEHGLQVDPDKVHSIKEYQVPKTIKHLRRFLGMVSWYWRLISDCASRTQALTRLLRTNQCWAWGEEQEKAFQDLKNTLMTTPTLTCPDFRIPFPPSSDGCECYWSGCGPHTDY